MTDPPIWSAFFVGLALAALLVGLVHWLARPRRSKRPCPACLWCGAAGRKHGRYCHRCGRGINATVNNSGPGPTEHVITVTNETTGLPIKDAKVWLTSDPDGVDTVWSGQTDTQGQVKLLAKTNTSYYLWTGECDRVRDISRLRYGSGAMPPDLLRSWERTAKPPRP